MGGFPVNWSSEASRNLRAIARSAVREAMDDPGEWINPLAGYFASKIRYDPSSGYFEIHRVLGGKSRSFHRTDPGEAYMALRESWGLELYLGHVENPYVVVQDQILGGESYIAMTDEGDF
jgi:hypothetical protein